MLDNTQGGTYGDAHSPLYLASDRRFHMYLRPPNIQTTCAQDTTRYHEVPIVRTEEVRVNKAVQHYQPLKANHA